MPSEDSEQTVNVQANLNLCCAHCCSVILEVLESQGSYSRTPEHIFMKESDKIFTCLWFDPFMLNRFFYSGA